MSIANAGSSFRLLKPNAINMRLFFSLLFFLGLAACSSQSLTLVHPQSGATVKCAAIGSGIMAGWAVGHMEECAQGYEKKGYLPVNKLTPQQRADLKRRGLLPQE